LQQLCFRAVGKASGERLASVAEPATVPFEQLLEASLDEIVAYQRL
jgi:hypothetical protein